jgi:N-carbamoylputrescine amidase
MRQVTIAAIQMSCSADITTNIKKAEHMVRESASKGAQIILLPELFAVLYFCQEKSSGYFQYAASLEQNKIVTHFQTIARELAVVLPISFFEKDHARYFNSVAIIDADGRILGVYRKTHIPDGPGYQEKYYFQPGDTGFKVWQTRYAVIGIGICWDQWFPEASRCMALGGAELLLYPTAIGSEPNHPEIDSKNHWQLCMQGHAAANIMPVIAANRVGTETISNSKIAFYGSSFVTNEIGAKITEADRASEIIIQATFDLEKIECFRDYWGVFRDRRPGMYYSITGAEPDTKP